MGDQANALAVCHYSLHRRWKNESWDVDQLTDAVKALGVEGIDYHAGLLGGRDGVVGKIRSAIARTGLILTGFSLSTNFNLDDDAAFDAHVEDTAAWLDVAAELKAPACRVFGGHVNRDDPADVDKGLARVVKALKVLAPRAERLGLILALENHGGLPCMGQEQVRVIEAVGSEAVRATVDVGNYMGCGQEPVEGTTIAAKYAAYVHIKDNKKTPGGGFEPCTVGQGDVDIPACMRILRDAGYTGYMVLEYEGPEDEKTGVPTSVRYMREALEAL